MSHQLRHAWILSPIIVLAALLTGAWSSAETPPDVSADIAEPSAEVLLRFAVLGDAEPKPDPVFPGVEAAVRDINAMAETGRIDFVIVVGDLAHDGTLIQYDNVTPVLQQLTRPFYPIMGNEEHNTTVERYLDYASRWNPEVTTPRYVLDRGPVVMVHASPDFSRDFDDDGIDWILAAVRTAAPKPVFLIVHAAQVGAYPENPEKGVANPRFQEVLAESNLSAILSGDLHMDMDRTVHSKQIGQVHYLHIPALERTKIPDETRHTPMFRVFTLRANGQVRVETFETGTADPLGRLAYTFALPGPAPSP
jgi:3',5'-cyclic AMP phosphodiesterase CpdA